MPKITESGALSIPAGATTGVTGPDLDNKFGARGIKVVVDITAIGTGSVTVTIQGKDRASGKYYTLLASAALVANATTVLTVYPGLAAAANAVASDVLPDTFRVTTTANNANPVTYTVGYSTLA